MTEQTPLLTSAAADRGPLAMEAISVSKDFHIGRRQILHAVRDVSFNLYRGAVVALVGESGSGKSTAARLLAGQERLTSGEIRLDGKPVKVTSRGDFRRYKSHVQLVFQDPFSSLNPVHTVRYHLERPVKLHQGRAANVDAEVVALMEQVRLTPARQFLAKYPHELSGGQRQRVSFARALVIDPQMPGGHFALAEAWLLQGNFGPGWEEYEWRFRLKGVPKLMPKDEPPLWDGKAGPRIARIIKDWMS